MIIACPHCAGLNRVAAAKLSAVPVCGKCKAPLFSGVPVEINNMNFANLVQKSELPIVLDFWASWCGPCQNFAPVFALAARELEPDFRFGKINTEQQQQLAAQFQIRSIPTLMLFQQGELIAQLSGALPKQQFYQWLQQQKPKLKKAE
ncbi:thioredoxin TrxC [Rheinheimera sp. 4Y26]|uniref:thioredoxin TrxC n=1 Tax=Rheinheimera sp. 4Y26 TaxID=2977811 RepID=UPI00391B880C